ncbi:unnamed protein product [Pipistrellus nathusii]|uniref:Uncharacterized protein n=1 Tax=Pipistrellus nathusii TaxID=59473 RepID=A0ABP0A7T3_PIPNA
MPRAPLHSPHGTLAFPGVDCCFYKMVTFIYYKYLCHNSDLLNGSWKKLFCGRTSYPQHCLSMPLPRVAWTVFVPEPSSSPSLRLGVSNQSPICPNKQGHFPADKGSPCFPLWPTQSNCFLLQMLSLFKKKKKSQCPKGTNEVVEKNYELLKCIRVGV